VEIRTDDAAAAAVHDVRAAVDLAAVGVVGVAAEPGLPAAVDLADASGAARVRVRQVADLTAGAAVLSGREQVRLAGLVFVAVAFAGAARTVERARLCIRIAKPTLTIVGHETGVADRAAVVAKRAAAIHTELVPVPNAVRAGGAGTEPVIAAHLALTIRGHQAWLAVTARLAGATAIDARLVAVQCAVFAAWLLAKALDALALRAIRRFSALRAERAAMTVRPAAVDVCLPERGVRLLIVAVVHYVGDEMVFTCGASDGQCARCGHHRERAATTGQTEQRHLARKTTPETARIDRAFLAVCRCEGRENGLRPAH